MRAVRARAAFSRAAARRRDRGAGRAAIPAVCLFVNDVCDAPTLELLAAGGTRLVALRCAGFNNVDLARRGHGSGLPVVRVPAYSPHAVAEFTVGLILTLNRQIHRAYNRTRDNNFALDGLLGFDLHGKTVGVDRHRQDRRAGGARAEAGLRLRGPRPRRGARPRARRALACTTCRWPSLRREADILTLHCPLTPQTRHLVGAELLAAGQAGRRCWSTPAAARWSTSRP